MSISIIIPTYDEENNIEQLILYLIQYGNGIVKEIIISDGGSKDNTIALAKKAGAVALLSPKSGRAAQLNFGASQATSDLLYFIHADTFPPPTFVKDILESIKKGFDFGRYKTKFNSNRLDLKINAWFTRFDWFMCMGADQTLFIKKSLFESCNGFNEEMKIMEEYEFCSRARATGKYDILKGYALISARKYESNSWLKVQLTNAAIVSMYRNGASQEEMVKIYKQKLRYRDSA